MKRHLVIYILPFFFLFGCREQPRWMAALKTGDLSLAAYHKPSARMFLAKSNGKEIRLLNEAKLFFAGHPEILVNITSGLKRREGEIPEEYEPGPALADSQGNSALAYFGRYQAPKVMAGVRLLFLFDRKQGLAKIFVYEVPLE